MLSKCCCCISLRTGSLIIAILGILGGIIFLGHSMTFHGFLILVVPVYGFLLYGAIERNEYAVLVWLLFNGVAIVLKIILGIIVIVGIIFIANIDNCSAVLEESKSIGLCFQIQNAMEHPVGLAIIVGIFIFGILLNIYFWICVYSFYKELKKEVEGFSILTNLGSA